MKKIYNIYLKIVSINLSMAFAYRANLIGSFVATSSWTLLVIVTMLIVIGKARVVAGWNQPELLLLTGTMLVIVGVFEIHFKRSFQRLSETIFFGNLDLLLVKPVDSQFLVSFIHMNVMGFLRMMVGVVFVCIVIIWYHIPISLFSIVSYLVFLLFGLACYYAIWLMASTLLIWYPRLSNLLEVINSLNHTTRFPPSMYREFNTYLFLFLLPYMFIVATPVKVLIHRAEGTDIIGLLVSALLLGMISRIFWRTALRSYTSSGG